MQAAKEMVCKRQSRSRSQPTQQRGDPGMRGGAVSAATDFIRSRASGFLARGASSTDLQTQERIHSLEEEIESVRRHLRELQAVGPANGLVSGRVDAVDAWDVLQGHSPVSVAPMTEPREGEEPIGWVPDVELEGRFDVLVLGGGPTGTAAATKAACLGRKALIVDLPKSQVRPDGLDVTFGGPTGLFSKALLEVAKTIDVKSLQSMGLDDDVVWQQVQNMCTRLAAMNAEHQVKILKDFKIAYVQGCATIISAHNVLVKQRTGSHHIVNTDNVLVATGSKPVRPANVPFDESRVFDSDTVTQLGFLPSSIAILGGGIIGVQYAKIFRKLGCEVTMIVRSTVLSALENFGLDRDIALEMLEMLKDDGITIHEGSSVVSIGNHRQAAEPLIIRVASKHTNAEVEVKADIFLAATDRTPTIHGFGLEKTGVDIAKKGNCIKVNHKFETNVPGIFAAGDVIGPPSLASTGAHQANAAVLAMFDENSEPVKVSFPVGVWTSPECGYYGLTSAAAHKKGMEVEEGIAYYNQCLRGRVFAPEGLLKLVFRKGSGVIIGVHIIGTDACELVHYGMDLVIHKTTIFKLMSTCFAAVTYHELFKEAAMNGNFKLAFGMEWNKILAELGKNFELDDSGKGLQKLRSAFDEMDTSGDGSLEADELMNVFDKLGLAVNKGTITNLIRLADDDGNGSIEWCEFEKIFKQVSNSRIATNGHSRSMSELDGFDRSPVSQAQVESPKWPTIMRLLVSDATSQTRIGL